MAGDRESMPLKIGPYKILKKLGTGGMGTVYRAVHVELNREVALKVLLPTAARNEAILRRFRAEARASAMPAHENIVVFYEHGEADGYHYLALEYIQGKDLLELIETHGTLPVGFSLNIIRQATKALQHANKHGFVHRDIKPSNFLITKEKVVKLTDMGLARQLEDLEVDRVTRDGTTVGTVDYMAPEQAKNSRDADTRSDIYSLGCTWYHLLTGETPYPGGAALERLYKHATEPTPSARDKNDKVPEEISAVIRKMMAKYPEERFQTPAELLETLERLMQKRPGSGYQFSLGDTDPEKPVAPPPPPAKESPRPPSAPQPPRKQPQNPIWLIGLGVGLVLFAAVGLVLFLSGSQPSEIAKAPPNPAPIVKDDESKKETTPAQPEETNTAPKEKPAETKPESDTRPETKDLEKSATTKPEDSTSGPETKPAEVKPTDTSPSEPVQPDESKEAPPEKEEKGESKPAVTATTANPPTPTETIMLDEDEPKDPTKIPEGGLFGDLKERMEKAAAENSKNARARADAEKDAEKTRRRALVTKNKLDGPAVPVIADPPPSMIPKLAQPLSPLSLSSEEEEAVLGPWKTKRDVQLPRPDKVFVLKRVETRAKGGEVHFSNLKTAWNAAMAGLAGNTETPGWVEVESQGPIYDGSHTFSERPFVLRAADGHAPVIVFEEGQAVTEPYWLDFHDNERCEIEGIHFVLFADDVPNQKGEFDLFRVEGCDVTFRKCTFTILGKHPGGINLLRMKSTKKTVKAPSRSIHFKDCVFRSELASALAMERPGADILVENCCFIVPGRQIFRFLAPDLVQEGAKRSLRVVNSTMVSKVDVIRTRIDASKPVEYSFYSANSSWVSILGNQRRPMMQFEFAEGTNDWGKVSWTSKRNSYVAWPYMLVTTKGGRSADVLAKTLEQWQKLWGIAPAEEVASDDKQLGTLPEDFLFQPYQVLGAGPWDFGDKIKATDGYDPSLCLAFSPHWFESSYGKLESLAVGMSEPVREFGEFTFTQPVTVDFNNNEQIADAVAKNPQATRLDITVIADPGKYEIAPVRAKGMTISLRLPKGADIVLIPKGEGDALFDIDGGSLEIVNGLFRWPSTGSVPGRFARVQKGDLRLDGCWIMTPLVGYPNAELDLIRFDSDPSEKSPQWRRLQMLNTMLVSPASLVAFQAPAAAIDVRNCLLVTLRDAFRLQFDEHPPAGWRGFLDLTKSTVSASGAIFHIYPFPKGAGAPSRPFAINPTDNIFTDILDSRLGEEANGNKKRTGRVVIFEGDVLDRELISWNGSYNAFDRVVNRMITPYGQDELQATSADNAWKEWLQTWGRRHESFAYPKSLTFKQAFRADKFSVDSFALSESDPANYAASDGKSPGANIADFGGKIQIPGRMLPPKTPPELTKLPLEKSSFQGPKTKPPETTATSTSGN
ncbi:MAG: protein kinase [Planctomycetota bacterium]